MLFDEEHYGKLISSQLSDYLKEWTTMHDRIDIAEEHNISKSLLEAVMRRERSLTKSNSIGIIDLARKAVHNCTHKIERAKKVKKQLDYLLNDDKRGNNCISNG
ncbi:hypothetical protein [Myroides odoratimimus]|uniref:hypothetical protein n=1 Tax=Myroides odoratimimus TaxID=76832 RepID=UPI000469D92C|nr:hypothetical protein [Myroides odoratimimus]MDM1396093.1 hypothetical protein [Myroides odoratimimus]